MLFFHTVKKIYIYNYNKTILIEILTSSFFLSDDATQSVNNSVVFGNGNKKVTIQELLDTSSDESFVFTGGNKHKKLSWTLNLTSMNKILPGQAMVLRILIH